MELIDLLRKQGGQYLRDIMPGGLLSPEIPPEMPTQTLKGLLGLTPVVGDAISGYDAIQSAREGNYGEAALNALGLLPFVPAMGGVIKGKGNLADIVKSREKAMKIAQKNAAKPISEGGLGLPKDNTAMDRAKAMGYEPGWAHGSPENDIKELLPSKIGAEGPGSYATNYLPESSTYAGMKSGATSYPLMVNKSKTLDVGSKNPYEVLIAADDEMLLRRLASQNKDAIVRTQSPVPDWLVDAGAPYMPERQHYVSMNPSNFRSPYAAFDPAKRHKADLMGFADPRLLALIAGGGLLGGAAYSE